MNLYKELIESAPLKARLKFGINDNVILKSVDFSQRKSQGMVENSNTYIALVQVDPETRKPIAQAEGKFWNIDPKHDMAATNFIDQFTTIAGLIAAIGGDVEEFETTVMEAAGGEDPEELVKTKEGAKTMVDAIQKGFKEQIEGKTDENCPLLRCKMVVNKKGFLELPKELNWVVPMDGDEEVAAITKYEHNIYKESLENSDDNKQEKPDGVGDAPKEESGESNPTEGSFLSGL